LTILLILIISFFAALVRSTLGFGEALIAVPFFLLFLPVDVAVPMAAILGLPLGILILTYANETIVKTGLGVIIILYSLYSLYFTKNKALQAENKFWLFLCGFLSGVFGGAYGINGPPLVVYGNLRQWSAKHFRATLQAYFLPVSLLSVVGYYAK